jgi:hypothetical protein
LHGGTGLPGASATLLLHWGLTPIIFLKTLMVSVSFVTTMQREAVDGHLLYEVRGARDNSTSPLRRFQGFIGLFS